MNGFDKAYLRFRDDVDRAIRDQALANERTVSKWCLNGMKGKLVKRNGVISVEPCPPEEDGQLVLHIYPDEGRTDGR